MFRLHLTALLTLLFTLTNTISTNGNGNSNSNTDGSEWSRMDGNHHRNVAAFYNVYCGGDVYDAIIKYQVWM